MGKYDMDGYIERARAFTAVDRESVIYAREDARAQLLAILHTLPDDIRGQALALLDRCCP